MTPPPSSSISSSLAARIAAVFSARHGIAYAQIAPDLTIVGTSENFVHLLQPGDIQIPGNSITDIFWEFIGAEDALEEVLQNERAGYQLDLINRQMDDGSTRYFNFLVIPLEENQPGTGLLLLIEDATHKGELEQSLTQDRNELRLAQAELYSANEELQRLDRLKSIFLAVAAHDLRAPLTAIYGNATLLRDDLEAHVTPENLESLSTIISQAEWLNRLISNILDLDQMEQGKLTINPQPLDFKALVRETTETLRKTAHLFDLSLTLDLPPEPISITADPDRIRQILNNLLSNAIKYTPSGGQIQISMKQAPTSAIFRIQDNGLGMSQEELDHLFQLYYRTPGAIKSGRTGIGLGLFIVKTLVDAHNGEIDVTSRPGQGTTFTVKLPAEQVGFSN